MQHQQTLPALASHYILFTDVEFWQGRAVLGKLVQGRRTSNGAVCRGALTWQGPQEAWETDALPGT